MDAAPDHRGDAPRACPECGAQVQQGQRRCINCGASVDLRRRLPRRTPLIAALSVAALAGAGVVVAQAAVTEQASNDASAPADVASAPVGISGPELPAATRPTSTKPKAPKIQAPDIAPQATSPLTIPSLSSDVIQAAEAARKAAEAAQKKAAAEAKKREEEAQATTNTSPTTPDLSKKIKVVTVANYDPNLRAGAEFGEPKAAIDKKDRTVWDVNVPADTQPFGVGIVLDLGDQPKHVSSIYIKTPTPGFGAVVYRTDGADLPDKIDDRWTRATKVKNVTDGLVVPITDDGTPKWTKYILVLLTTPRGPDDTRAAISDLEVLP